ncbi:MAG: non-ribosomal peptide synthase/polyketide synthase, partial [Gammaproteobacteria bacterium]|nr:non-ribosomal peptide synthase/polyketide synthase [Gammaproteobacteria bacterium]
MTAVTILSLLAKKGVKLSVVDGQLKVSAPKGALTGELRQQLVDNKAEILELLISTKSTAQDASIAHADRDFPIPLSFGQERLWFLNELEPGSSLYNIPTAIKLKGHLNLQALQQAFDLLLERHESLRTTFTLNGEQPVQKIANSLSIPLEIHDAGDSSDDDLDALLTKICLQPFDIKQGPLLKLYVLDINENEHALLLVIHHIIADGWSMGVLMSELAALYNSIASGGSSTLEALPIQFADYAAWQRETMSGETLNNELSYWKKALDGAPLVLDLPTDHARPASPGYEGAWLRHQISSKTRSKLEALAQNNNATLYMVLLSAFNLLLSRYSGSEDLLIGSPVAGRSRTELEGLVGTLINTVVLRGDLSGNPQFTALLKQLRNTTLDAFEHQELPFEKLVEQLQPERNLSHAPIYQVLFNLQNRSQELVKFDGLKSSALVTETGTAKLDLHLLIEETDEGLTAWFEYATELFDEATIERMASHFDAILAAVVDNPDLRADQIPLLTDDERNTILNDWNDTTVDYPQNETLVSLFEKQVDSSPDAIAVEYHGQQLSYKQLDQRANQLAHELLSMSIGTNDVVGVYMERSIEMIVALYGVQKAGAAYTPLDPEYPPQRLANMLEDSGTKVILTQAASTPEGFTGTVIALNSDGETGTDHSNSRPDTRPSPDDLAYVIFTSGSTGRPKGVMNEHRGIVNRLQWMQSEYQLSSEDHILQKTAFSFDVSVWEFFWPLLNGARLVMAKPGGHKDAAYLADTIRQHNISTIHFVPSMLQAFLLNTDAGSCPQLKRVICSGEALPWELTQEFYAKFDAQLHNLYGPTEAAIDVTYWAVPRSNTQNPIPIGKPVANTRIYIVDKSGQLAPIGVPGELLIAGAQVARGYIGRDELTAERFITDPFKTDHIHSYDSRSYRTGDLARYLPSGDIEYLGRIDGQIKLRGFRIELGEIDAALSALSTVEFCTTVVSRTANGDQRLVSYVGGAANDAEAIKTKLRTELPEYMVPAAIVFIDKLPLTLNGKLDRNALPEPAFEAAIYVAPSTVTEIALARLFSQLLDKDKVGINDDFFALGGHSLLAMRLVTRIGEQLKTGIELKQLFIAPTVKQLAYIIDSDSESIAIDNIKALPRDAELPLSFAQQRLWFLHKLMPDSSLYNVPWAMRLEGSVNTAALQQSINMLLARHETLHTRFIEIAGEPMQYLAKDAELPLHIIDLRLESAAKVQQALSSLSQKTFSLDTAPLLRVHLLRDTDNSQILLFVIHHIIADAWSLGLLFDELMTLYAAACEGIEARLAPLAIQYADYAAWQRNHLSGDELQKQLSFWRSNLRNAPAILELPSDRARPAVQSYRGKVANRSLPQELLSKLHQLGNEQGATLFTTMLAAFNVMLSRYSGQNDVVVGTPVAGRQHSDLEGLIGFFLNTLPIRSKLDHNSDFRQLLQELQLNMLDAYAHQDLPFEQLVEDLQPERDMSIAPIFQVMFTLQTVGTERTLHGDLNVSNIEIDYGTAKYDITWSVMEKNGELSVSCEYASDLFNESTIQRMLEHYQVLLQNIVSQPGTAINQLAILSTGEQSQLRAWNSTTMAYPDEQSLQALFEQQALSNPAATAVEFNGSKLSYKELNERANGLAAQLIELGAGPNQPVAICVNRSLDTLVGLLGILKSGSGYVPLDPIYPAERIAYMLEDSDTKILVSEPELASALPTKNIQLLDIADSGSSQINPSIEFNAEQLAYLIYTSGSTGLPKGVQIEHRAVTNFLHSMAKTPGIVPADRLLAVTTLCFDISVLELFLPLAQGATVVIASQEQAADGFALKALLETGDISIMQATPASWRMLLDAGWNGSANLKVLVGGEALERDLATQLEQHNQAVWNMYGPTETTIWSACHQFNPADQLISVGQPIANTQFYVLDDAMQAVPVGVPGTLWIGGHGVARGYWQRDELNAASFIDNPFGSGRIYATGDRVRWLSDGSLEVLGRNDFQVKLRGFRIELGEIETRLAANPNVTQSVVSLREDSPGDQRLVAYNIAPEGVTLNSDELRNSLMGGLPDYMLPSAYVQLERFPLTANGKIDRKALPAPEWEDIASTEYLAPQNPTEDTLTAIWADILGVPKIGMNDDFFALGGHSLLAVKLISRVRDELGHDLDLMTLFSRPTIAAMAALLESDTKVLQAPISVVDRSTSLPLSSAQVRLWFLDELEPENPAYNMPWSMRLKGIPDTEALQVAIDQVIARHESLRTTFPAQDGEPVQLIHESLPVPLQVEILDGDEAALVQRLTEISKQPFDLHNGPLLRANLIQTSDNESVLSLCIHHIIYDAGSHGILMQELSECYAAYREQRAATLRSMPIQFADYAAWEHEWMQGPDYQQQLRYWSKELSGAPNALEFPTDFSRPAVQTSNGERFFYHLPDSLHRELTHLGQKNSSTLFMVLLAAFDVLLARYSGQDDIVVSVPISGRKGSELENIIGFFLNTLPIRVQLEDHINFNTVLKQVRDKSLAAYANQEMPFGKLVEELAPERDTSRPPIAQMHFVLQHVDNPTDEFAGLAAEKIALSTNTTKFDMTLFAFEVGETLAIDFEYNSDLYKRSTIEQLATHYVNLLESIVAQPTCAIDALPMLDSGERNRLVVEWNNTNRPYPADATLQTLLEAQVALTPDAPAIEYAGTTLTYAEFNRRANQLAHVLINKGIEPEHLVGVCLERSAELVIALHAIQKAGAGYVPLDPDYPMQRLEHILEDANVSLLITDSNACNSLPPHDTPTLLLGASEIAASDEHNPTARSKPENIAYVIFTSGSTGRPKGVMNEHRGIVNRLLWMQDEYQLTANDKVLQKTPFSFDVSVWEFFWPLLSGATLVVAKPDGHKDPAYLAETIINSEVTTMHFVPSMLQAFLQHDKVASCDSLRQVICSGEALPLDLQQRFYSKLDASLHNLYGPTEAAIDVTYWACQRDSRDSFVPIGRPIANTSLYIVDTSGQPVPAGVSGELWIGGVQVARGYVNRPELTAERFIINPFSDDTNSRIYRTGDLVRYRDDGRIEFLGRLDDQIKLRGFRIELGEIETELLNNAAVQNAVVMAREDREGDQRLVAYLLADTGNIPTDEIDDWQDDQVDQWRALWEDTYSRDQSIEDLTFDITGWDSSYTNEPIPAEEMQAWVDVSCDRILELKPKLILEVGSGSGLLASRIGPKVAGYIGTDFSAAAAQRLNDLRMEFPKLSAISGLHKAADEIGDLPEEAFDTVVINSVAQYFPNMAYFDKVLRLALERLEKGGRIFLGDLRSLSLLNAHHTSVQLFKAEDHLESDEIIDLIQQNIRDEEELVIDPTYFLNLKKELPQITGVRFELKRGKARNELSRFRYDVVLTTAVVDEPRPEIVLWDDSVHTIEGLAENLSDQGLLIRHVPDARLSEERIVTELLEDTATHTAAELRNMAVNQAAGIEPEAIYSAAKKLRLDVQMIGTEPGFMNVLLMPKGLHYQGDALLSTSNEPLMSLGNNPLYGRLKRNLVPKIQKELEQALPDYMVPSAFVVLEKFPLTASGKIDRKALPAPKRIRDDDEVYVAPRDGIETVLTEIWSGVLGIDQIGINDNFFSLGGHSLLATQMISRVREQLNVDIALVAIFNHPTIASLAAVISDSDAASEDNIIKPAIRGENMPLSFSQQRLWFINQMDSDNTAYNSPWPIRLEGNLDINALQEAINYSVARHEILRTTYASKGGKPQQLIDPNARIQLQVEEMPGASEAELQERISTLAHETFELATGPLMRTYVLRYADDAQVLFMISHHINNDAWSNAALLKELSSSYNALINDGQPDLPALDIQYADYAVWQRNWMKGAQRQNQLDYWTQQLSGAPDQLGLPTDKPRPAVQTYAGAFETRLLSEDLLKNLQRIALENETTLFMVLLAAFNVLLSVQARQEDVVVGTPIAGRRHAGLENLIGVFLNMLPIRIDLSGKPSFIELLKQVRGVTLAAYSHEDLPFEMLVEELQPSRDMSYAPIFQVMFDVQTPSQERNLFDGLYQSAMESDLADAKVDMTLTGIVLSEGLKVRLDYNTDLFEASSAQRIMQNFETLLKAVIKTPDVPVTQIDLTSAEEQQQLQALLSATEHDYARPDCLHQLFERQVSNNPGATALTCDGESLSYAELNACANRLAHHLIAKGVTADTLIGISMERSLDLVVSILGVLKAGGGYLPLDPNYPEDRLAFMVEDSQTPIIVTHEAAAERVPASNAEIIVLGTLATDLPENNPDIAVSSSQLAYVIYTSGSSGKPKGVLIEHANVTRLMRATEDWYGFNDNDVWTLFHSYAFDFTVWELWGSLLYGGRLVVVPYFVSRSTEEFYNLLADEKVTVLNQTPSAFSALMRVDETAAKDLSLRYVVFGGEALDLKALKPWFERHGDVKPRLVNMYGITETTVHVTYRPLELADCDAPSSNIGVPIPDLQVYVLNEARTPVPVGAPGELYVGGAGLARGYLNRPELTEERFIPHPFDSTPGARLYRTGDLARRRPDGDLEYMGRADDQVKLRGFRIELGEIESALLSHAAVNESIVVLIGETADDRKLVAYVVPTPNVMLEVSDLRQHLKESLPDYMVPAAIIELDALPLTANGKVDRKSLPAPEWARAEDQPFAAPRTPVEEALLELWREMLDEEDLGIHDDFFELGGHSLLATQLIARIGEVLEADVDIRILFEAATVAEFAELMESEDKTEAEAPISPTARDEDLPLSFAQQRLWFLDQLDPENAVYNIPWAIGLSGQLRMAALQNALDVLVQRHEVLRTSFPSADGNPLQLIAAAAPIVIDAINMNDSNDSALQNKLAELAQAPFNLSEGPLLRAHLICIDENEHILILVMHHIISDGWSLNILFRELVLAYESACAGQQVELPSLPIQYADYATWQRQWLTGDELDRQVNYWRDQLTGAPAKLELPTDKPRPAVQTFNGDYVSRMLSSELQLALKEIARDNGCTFYMVLLAAFNVLLYRYSGQDDLVVGTPIAGRRRSELDGLVGFFINTLVLRSDASGQPTFLDFLERVRKTALGAYASQELPFEKLVDELQPVRDMSHTPLFQVMFILQNAPWDAENFEELKARPVPLQFGTAKFDLTLSMAERKDGLEAYFEFNTDLYEKATVERMLDHLEVLAAGIIENPQQQINELPLLKVSEQQQILHSWNNTAVNYNDNSTMPGLISAQATVTPDAQALLFEDQVISYAELEIRSNRLANYLVGRGVGKGDVVALSIDRSPEVVTGILGIMKTGAAYVPMDPTYPKERLAYMLQDSGASMVVTRETLIADLPQHELATTCFDRDASAIEASNNDTPAAIIDTNDLAYIIYTSGSTGQPKGVMVEHHSVCNLVDAQSRAFGLGPDDRMLQFASISFDASVYEIVKGLTSGATLCIASADEVLPGKPLLELLQSKAITAVTLPPSALYQLPTADLPALKTITVAGEACPPELVSRWQPGRRFFNLYGPTEFTVWATYKECFPGEAITIGHPISNAQAYVLDENLQLLPVKVPGELCISGASLARGYWNRKELTAERFVANPFSEDPDARMYRTGDRVQLNTNGEIEFLGRIDHQVKIRGFRIELGEIESRLNEHPAVTECLVMANGAALDDKNLVAYIVTDAEPALNDLRSHLQETLPDFMVPAGFVVLNEWPLTPNGKIDRKALPDAGSGKLSVNTEYVAPTNRNEDILADIWGELLGAEQVGVHDNFFELGGDSILSIQIIARATQRGLNLTPKQLFQNQTIAELALAISADAPVIDAEQGRILGDVPLTPIQQWFLEQDLEEAQHFNQSMLVDADWKLDPVILEQALHLVTDQHDALRLRFSNKAGTWQQELAPFEDTELLQQLHDASDEQLDALQASMGLNKGPLLRAAQLSETKLLLVVHHMAIDWVSWTTLLTDLEFAYERLQNARPVTFPNKTTSFKAWGERLSEWAGSQALQSELSYWKNLAWDHVAELPVDHADGDNTEAYNQLHTLQLNAADTSGILKGLANRYRAAPRDVLLTAVATALAQHTNSQSVLIDLEGHGREDLFDDVDLTRTVGWFTTLYPVLLKLPAVQSAANTLPAVRDQLAALPNNGIGYGVLRYLSADSGLAEQTRHADVSFNYLGNIDRVAGSNSMFTTLNEAHGLEHSKANVRPHKIDINCMISEDQLYINFGFSTELFDAATIAALASKVETELRQLIAIGDSGSGLRITPASFPLAQLNQTELDILLPDDKPVDEIYPLTPLQQGMLFHSLLDNTSDVYLASFNWLLEGKLDIPLFEKAWNLIINQHSSLRSATQWQGIKTPVQVVYGNVEVPFETEDWTNYEPLEQEARLAKWFTEDRAKRFDLANAPLTRVSLLQLSDTSYRMVWSFHHMIMDGWSIPLVIREVFTAYEAFAQGETPKVTTTRPFSDYIAWLLAQDQSAAQSYWRETMQGFTAPTPLPSANIIDVAQNVTPNYDEIHFGLPDSAGHALKTFAQQNRLTVNTIMQGAWALLLSRYSGEDDVVFGATTAGRPAQLDGIESMIGLFLNTLPVRIGIDENLNLLAWLQQVQDQQLNIQQYEYASLVDIQGWSDVPRGTALFETLLAFENYPDIETMGRTSGSIEIKESSGFDRTNFPLTLNVAMMDTLYLRFVYDRNLFSKETLERLGEHLLTLLKNIPEAANKTIAEVTMLGAEELQQVLVEWNDTRFDYPADETMHGLFEQQVKIQPDSVAIYHDGREISYGDLNARANQLAHRLIELGIGNESLVAVCTERTIEMITGMLAILKAGGAYVPADPDYPVDRVSHMLEDSQAPLVLTNSTVRPRLPATDAQIISLDEFDFENSGLSTENPGLVIAPERLGYTIYTSGSTGLPKGVEIEHRNAVALIEWMRDTFKPEQMRGVLASTSVCFDLSIYEIFGTLGLGGRIVLV